MTPTLAQRLTAEAFGTFWLVFGGCGAAVFAGKEIGFLGVALAFGLTVLTMAYAVGHVSGGHFNPAVTVGLATAKRFDWKDVPAYVVTQVVAAIGAALVLWIIAHGVSGFDSTNNFALNGYGDHSPGGYSWWAVLIAETVLTAAFLFVILGVTDTRAPKGFAPLAIGLALTLIHLICIPISNTSVNPARSIGPALFGGSTAIVQLWLFILAPLLGALIAGAAYAPLFGGGLVARLEETTEP
jgi:aquaporin Z